MKLAFLRWGTLCALVALAAHPVSSLKVYAAGSGQGMLSRPETVAEIIALSEVDMPYVVYLGTATYDDPSAQKVQTDAFVEAGCTVASLKVALTAPDRSQMEQLLERAQVLLVSGGNTLFAYDRWVAIGLDTLMHAAMERGVVMAGGSAGAIVWFDGGHSDSMDSESYKNPPGPLLNPNLTPEQAAFWAYVRVPGLRFLPGLLCPHYDMTQSNGQLRAVDMQGMLQRHSGEQGFGVDNWAALVVDGTSYHIVSREGESGSVGEDDQFVTDRSGRPGAWALTINADTGAQDRVLIPAQGQTADLLTVARFISPSNMLTVARAQNPDDGVPPTNLTNWVKLLN